MTEAFLDQLVRQEQCDVEAGLRLALGDELPDVDAHFPNWAHPGQLPPPGDWRTWAIIAGRGFGKTRAWAEWVLSIVRGEFDQAPPPTPLHSANDAYYRHPELVSGSTWLPDSAAESDTPPWMLKQVQHDDLASLTKVEKWKAGSHPSALRIALVGATVEEVWRVIVEGPSGLLALAREGEIAGGDYQGPGASPDRADAMVWAL